MREKGSEENGIEERNEERNCEESKENVPDRIGPNKKEVDGKYHLQCQSVLSNIEHMLRYSQPEMTDVILKHSKLKLNLKPHEVHNCRMEKMDTIQKHSRFKFKAKCYQFYPWLDRFMELNRPRWYKARTGVTKVIILHIRPPF